MSDVIVMILLVLEIGEGARISVNAMNALLGYCKWWNGILNHMDKRA